MSKSAIRKLGVTKRVVASSGIAAALLAVSPVAVAMADDTSGGATGSAAESKPTSVTDTEQTSPPPSADVSRSGGTAGDAATAVGTSAVAEAGTGGVDMQPTSGVAAPSQSESPDSAPVAAEPAATSDTGGADGQTPETTQAPAGPAPASGAAAPTNPESSAQSPVAVNKPPSPSVLPPHVSKPTAAGERPVTGTHTDTPGSGSAQSGVGPDRTTTMSAQPISGGASVSGAVITAVGSAVGSVTDALTDVFETVKEGIIGQIVGDHGTQGLILVNQGAVAAAVLNRRSRDSESDSADNYLAMMQPGESVFVPERTVADLSLGKHSWDAEADDVELTEPTAQTFAARSVMLLSTVFDAGNLFLDPDDSDFSGVDYNGMPNGTVVYGNPDDAGLTYTVSDDGASVTISNGGSAPVAVIDSINASVTSTKIIDPGSSASYSTGSSRNLAIQGQRVDANGQPTGGGTPVVLGLVQVTNNSGTPSVSNVTGTQVASVRNSSSQLWAAIDPDNKYLDAGDDPASLQFTPGNPTGLSYELANDGSTITFHNDSEETVALMGANVYSNAPLGNGIYVIAPHESATAPTAPYAGYYVETPRDSDGKVGLLGFVLLKDGMASSVPIGTVPAIPSVEELNTDPGNLYWNPTDSDPSTGLVPTNAVGANPVTDGVYYSVDGHDVTVYNDGTKNIAVLVTSVSPSGARATHFTEIAAGTTHTVTVASGVTSYVVVEGQRVSTGPDTGKPALYGVVIAQNPGTGAGLQTITYDLFPNDGIPTISTHKWLDADPDNRFWDPGDSDTTTQSVVPATAVGGDAAADGVYYSTGSDGITFHNGSDHDIAIVVTNPYAGSNDDQQSLVVVSPGDRFTFNQSRAEYSSAPVYLTVQAPRVASGVDAGTPVLYGVVMMYPGTSTSPATYSVYDTIPGDTIAPITSEFWRSADPSNSYWTPGDPDQTYQGSGQYPRFAEMQTLADAGVTYTYDSSAGTVTITNSGTHDVAVVNSRAENFDVLAAGTSKTYSVADSSFGQSTYLVQGARNAQGKPVVYGLVSAGYGSAYAQDGTALITNNAPYASSNTTGYSGTVKTLDPDGDTTTMQLTGQPLYGTVVFDPATGAYVYTPNAGVEHQAASGQTSYDSFLVTITDQYGASSQQNIGVQITPKNQVPVGPGSTVDGGTAGSVGVTDPDGDHLSYYVASGPTKGSVVVNADGTYVYTPTTPLAHGDTLSDSFSVYVFDGHGGSLTVPVSVTATGDNAAPTAQLSPGQNSYSGTVLGSDQDNDPLTYAIGTGATNGIVTVDSSTGAYTYMPNAGAEHAAAGDGPTTDSFTVLVSDGHGGTATVTVPVTLAPKNLAPTASATGSGATGAIAAQDADHDPLAYTVSGQPVSGSVVVDSHGSYTYTPTTPVAHGSTLHDSFDVTVDDGYGGSAVVPVAVTLVGPNAVPTGSVTRDGDAEYAGTVVGADTDNDSLIYTVVSGPSHGSVTLDPATGQFSYTPNAGVEHAAAAGGASSDAFEVKVSDGYGGSVVVPVAVTLTPKNTLPTVPDAVAGSYTGSVAGTDADLDALSYTVIGQPLHGTVTVGADGSYVYTPNAGAEHAAGLGGPASDAFEVTVSDGHGGSVNVPVAVVITPKNTAPTGTVTVGSADAAGVVVLTPAYTDADGDPVTVKIIGAQHGTVTDNGDGTYTYTPDSGYAHEQDFVETLTVTASDGALETATQAQIAVAKRNATPTIAIAQGAAAASTGAVTVTPTVADADGDTVTTAVTTQPTGGTVTSNADGTFTYTPNAAKRAAGDYSDSFTITASDGHGGISQKAVTVAVKKPAAPAQTGWAKFWSGVAAFYATVHGATSSAWNYFWHWLVGALGGRRA